MKIYCYPKCSTCKKATNWLDENNISYDYVDIKQNPPSVKDLKDYYKLSKLPLKKFFNTSGNSYKELNMKERFHREDEDTLLERLSNDGMLIKRPLLVTEDKVLLGFKEDKWTEELL